MDWGKGDPLHSGWWGKCLINTNTAGKPLDVSEFKPGCIQLIAWDWPEHIVNLVCGIGEGK